MTEGKMTRKKLKELVLDANRSVFSAAPHGVSLDNDTLYLQSRKEMANKVVLYSGGTRELYVALQVVINLTNRRRA